MNGTRAMLLALGVAGGAAAAAIGSGCAAGPAAPVAIDTANDQCAGCRMVISDTAFAAQVVAPGEEPRLYDDLQCLRDGLAAAPPGPGARVFVTDHRTRAWVPAGSAVYVRVPDLATPMASHWAAYASEESRRADPYARGGEPVAAAEVLGRYAGPPAGSRP